MDVLLFICLFFNRPIKMRRRSRHGRMFALGLLFIIYSAINVYSSSDIDSATRSELDPNDLSTILPKSDDPGSNDDIAASASTLETTQSTTSTTKGLLSILNFSCLCWQNNGKWFYWIFIRFEKQWNYFQKVWKIRFYVQFNMLWKLSII